jgi:hypothetical protein
MDEARGEGPPTILVVYGDPPRMKLHDVKSRPLHETFALTPKNQLFFQRALIRALSAFVGGHLNLSNARFRHIRTAAQFSSAIAGAKYTHVIYYGHALMGTNVLLPANGSNISPARIVESLTGTSVRHFDILGCRSTSIAAEVSLKLPGISIGYLRQKREDNVVVSRGNPEIEMTIDPQPIYHFGAEK